MAQSLPCMTYMFKFLPSLNDYLLLIIFPKWKKEVQIYISKDYVLMFIYCTFFIIYLPNFASGYFSFIF